MGSQTPAPKPCPPTMAEMKIPSYPAFNNNWITSHAFINYYNTVLPHSWRGACVPVMLKKLRLRIVFLSSPPPTPVSRLPGARQTSTSPPCRRRMKSWRARQRRRERSCRKSLIRATGCSRSSWLPRRSCPHWRRPRALWTSRSRTSTHVSMTRWPMPLRMLRGRPPNFRPGWVGAKSKIDS